VKGRNPSLATKAGLGAGSTLPGLGWRLRRRWIPARARITSKVTMHMSSPRPVVHLELHTGDHARASAFYAELLCWRQELIEAGSGSCLALGLGGRRSVISAPQCGERAIWQPKP
jgi:hypothetical protein